MEGADVKLGEDPGASTNKIGYQKSCYERLMDANTLRRPSKRTTTAQDHQRKPNLKKMTTDMEGSFSYDGVKGAI